MTPIGNGAALISWSGSMFEYLMPALIVRAPRDSLLDETNRLIVKRQMQYGHELGLPWGMSESAYNARDLELTYQYSNFGVPGLGLKRGLSENQVIAPYASALAAMVDPAAAVRNLSSLTQYGALGRYGYYEAIDFTRSRLPEGTKFALVRAYMAHHQGMTLVAIANVLFDGRMRERFHSEPMIQATELLLQERAPRDVSVIHPRAEEVQRAARVADASQPPVRRLFSPHDATAQVHLLSNGRYAVMLTGAGSGYSRWNDLAVTRWRADGTRDDTGSYIFLRDVESGRLWSAGYQPVGVEPDRYEVTLAEDHAEFLRTDAMFVTKTEILVSPEDDAEARRVSITNTSSRWREVDVTSFAELVLAAPASDLAHPAFSKLFVQTEYVGAVEALLATRRVRTADEAQMWAAHHTVVEGESLRPVEYETDRARFVGRGRELRQAISVWDGRRLSNTVGTVLDPVFSLRHRVRVPAGGTVKLTFWTLIAASRDEVLRLLDKHREATAFVRAGTLAWTQAQVQLRHLGIDAAEAGLFQRLASHVLFANGAMRPSSETIVRGAATPALLWAQGISGDLPIVLLRIDDVEDIDIARQLLRAQEYWRLKQLAVDLVFLNERDLSYIQDLQVALETQLSMSQSRPRLGNQPQRGSVHILRTDLIAEPTRALLCAVARVVLVAQRGSLVEQLDRRREPLGGGPIAAVASIDEPGAVVITAPANLEFFNGIGGFAAGGREYQTYLNPGQSTPAPWINVIANPNFGFQVAVEGSGYTWALNSRDRQLTPWSNDPVTDRPGEVIYVRDEDNGEIWGPTALPIREPETVYSARHGQGYSRFEHSSRGVALDLLLYVPLDDSVKLSRLRIRNDSQRVRHLSVTAYVEWVLGSSQSASAPYIITAVDVGSGALLARNPWGIGSGARVAFADLAGRQSAWTCDRREFLGRHGTLARPAALLAGAALSKRAGAGLDPCAALQGFLTLAPGESTEICHVLGEAADIGAAQALIAKYRGADLDAIYAAVCSFWDDTLGRVQVSTPDRAMDILLNRWLLYQTLTCRLWARSAFYQASGAYGFRDQLQDCMAMTLSRPALTREHLLRAAARQFTAGDVQHWWLPQSGQGVRTRISDDRVWLGFVVAEYLQVTGDLSVLDERVTFIEGQVLRAGESDAFFQPVIADETASLYEHCARALDNSLAVGAHGLPLIGTGDWNDGFNRVGEAGRGESVWLAWFLYATLLRFVPLAQTRGDQHHVVLWTSHAEALRSALETHGWDGAWYRRAYFDDGTPLGSASNAECRIDAIAQSWAVLSGAAPIEHAKQAMQSMSRQLIRSDSNLALLFTPPIDKIGEDPGYIRAYPPGIRENGGQYTHAALWSVIALAELAEGTQASALFALLNPINRTRTRPDVHRYKVEPYVVAADVYSEPPHVGRGGWTWYTGSAAWMYRAGVESILGLRVRAAHLQLRPCLPESWPRAQIVFKHGRSRYEILLERQSGGGSALSTLQLDGVMLAAGTLELGLVDDGGVHRVHLRIGRP